MQTLLCETISESPGLQFGVLGFGLLAAGIGVEALQRLWPGIGLEIVGLGWLLAGFIMVLAGR